MDVSPISANGPQAASTATLTADFNMFLQLLTTQLQYQDPLDPMDTSEYTQQLVSYSQVEQAIQQTGRLDQMFARMADIYEKDTRDAVKRFTSLFEPLVILFMGVVVGAMILSIMLAITSINEIAL